MYSWDFNSAKWDIMSAFGDLEASDMPDDIKKLEKIANRSDDARRILMPVIETVRKLTKQVNDNKVLFEKFRETQYAEFNIPEDECDEDGDGE